MGNQRRQGKKNATVWFNEDYQGLLESLKETLGLNQSQILKVSVRLLSDPTRDINDIVKEVLEEEVKEKGGSK